jgi:butyrate kinase
VPRQVLVINPGSTSTKIAVFEDGKDLFHENLALSAETVAGYDSVLAQLGFRENQLRSALESRGYDVTKLSAVVGRGGTLRPLPGGVYSVNQTMLDDISSCRMGEHASNLGAFLALKVATPLGIGAYIADPVVVDELCDVARVSGHKLFERKSIFHALNQKAVARRWCRERGQSYEEVTLIIAHLGGGASIGLHRNGRVVDVNNALNGEGPFSAERAGTLPAADLIKLCFSGKYSEKEVLAMETGRGGFVSLEGTNDLRVVEERIAAGDRAADLHLRAFAYGIAKAIGALAAAASGKVDAIILTGGMAYSTNTMTIIDNMCNFIGPVVIYPGEGELEALADAGFRVLSGETVALEY